MTRSGLAAVLVAAMVAGIARPAPVRAQDKSDLAGRWTLNRELSKFPREIGFGAAWAASNGTGPDTPEGGGGGRRGSGGGGAGPAAFSARRESPDDAKRLQQLTAEVRNPPSHLTIVDAPAAVTITDDRGQTRTFHPNVEDDVVQLDGVPVGVATKREAGRLVVLYDVEQGRELRYAYSRTMSPPQLVVDVQFLERGGGDSVRRIYEPAGPDESMTAPPAPPSPAAPKPGSQAANTAGAGKGIAPADHFPAPAFNQQPDAELKGLTKLGVVVEGLNPQAAVCGVSQGPLETAVSKRLSDAGFTVARNSDEDTYVYVNVVTTNLPSGFCVSRYDVFLYTHTTATLSYQQTPVLIEVSLLHKGGLAGSASTSHAGEVLRGVQEYVDQFVTRIRDADK